MSGTGRSIASRPKAGAAGFEMTATKRTFAACDKLASMLAALPLRFCRSIVLPLKRLPIVVTVFALSPGVVSADAASDLFAARELWRAASISTYSFVYTSRNAVMIAPPCNWDVLRTRVRKGKATLSVVISGIGICPPGTVLSKSQLEYVSRTFEDLFADVERLLRLGPEVTTLDVKYDPLYGFPVHLRAEKRLSDSDEGFEITDFSPAK
jgi:Family of unknown function (DUF6174)